MLELAAVRMDAEADEMQTCKRRQASVRFKAVEEVVLADRGEWCGKRGGRDRRKELSGLSLVTFRNSEER